MYFSARERHKYGSQETLVWLTSHTCIAHEPCKCPTNEWQVSYKGGKNGVKKKAQKEIRTSPNIGKKITISLPQNASAIYLTNTYESN